MSLTYLSWLIKIPSGNCFTCISSKEGPTATTPYEAAKTKLKDETDPPVNCLFKTSSYSTDFSSGVPAASTHHADDPDSAGGGSFNPAGSATPMTGSAVP
ncbi:hypothetical protein Tco_1179818, partial [Tanacetum coccineum]